ncbi:MAG: hypothetical protein H2069_04795 [Legionella sp.]|nr:hypothetical protein [Legionella sp.]
MRSNIEPENTVKQPAQTKDLLNAANWDLSNEIDSFLNGDYLHVEKFQNAIKRKYVFNQALPQGTEKFEDSSENLICLLSYELSQFDLTKFHPSVIAAYETIKGSDFQAFKEGLPPGFRDAATSGKTEHYIAILLTATIVAQKMRERGLHKLSNFYAAVESLMVNFSKDEFYARWIFTFSILKQYSENDELKELIEIQVPQANKQMKRIDDFLKSDIKQRNETYNDLQQHLENHPLSDGHRQILANASKSLDLEDLTVALTKYEDHVSSKLSFHKSAGKKEKRRNIINALQTMIVLVPNLIHQGQALENFEIQWNKLLNNQSKDPDYQIGLADDIYKFAVAFLPNLNRQRRRIGDQYDRRFEEAQEVQGGKKKNSISLNLIREQIIDCQAEISNTYCKGMVNPQSDEYQCHDLKGIRNLFDHELGREFWEESPALIRLKALSLGRYAILVFKKTESNDLLTGQRETM